jgi:hypothetical protein
MSTSKQKQQQQNISYLCCFSTSGLNLKSYEININSQK